MNWLRDVDKWLCDEVLPHQGAFLALARRITGLSETSRDIVQDVYAEILAGEGWRNARDPKAFVMRIVYCRAINWVNRQKVVPMRNVPSLELMLESEDSPDAFDVLSGREELTAVMEALDQLPQRCREVVTMRRLDELSPPEIAKKLGITVTTVDRHLGRGIAMLIEKLGDRMSRRRRKPVNKSDRSSAAE
jgi:RNA polymerase sigma-70 factor (ECF subfamily)